MAQPKPSKPAQQNSSTGSKKRKEAPTSNNTPGSASKKQKTDHRARQRDARALSTQTASKAFSNGALDVDAFVKAREFEMRALESSMQRSKKGLNRRAFQQVPKELRRRTASHNVKRIPKRLRERGRKEMIEDNTPTVTARRRKPTRHMRLRLETVKRLRALGAQKKAAKEKAKQEQVTVLDPNGASEGSAKADATTSTNVPSVTTRKAKVKKASLAKPPVPKIQFRKRQIHKSWLPTHLFHAKRAHMTPPSAPLWRFAIPLTPTQKSYRPTHRASHERGAIAWDMSYIATIGLQGEQRSLEGLLKALGVGMSGSDASVRGRNVEKWRRGVRVLETSAMEREAPHRLIAPTTVIWCAASPINEKETAPEEKRKRKMFLRVHPSAFYQLWEEVVRLSKVAKPSINVEDLRFEIGSIEVTGPGSTEALLGALWPAMPIGQAPKPSEGDAESTWRGLAGVTDPAALPSGALLSFSVHDPRLHHPPRTIQMPKTQEAQYQMLELLSKWPVDRAGQAAGIFDRKTRLRGSKLASQKAINRRKGLTKPGEYPASAPTDPHIPVLLYTRTSSSKSPNGHKQASWTVLAPWKTIQPIWYSLMYYPLSTGQQPRFGGMREQQQLAFEAGQPWFPADYPGTNAGWEWEIAERRRRWEEWRKRPKGKRVSWEKVDLGDGRKGEIGEGWSCDWNLLLGEEGGKVDESATEVTDENGVKTPEQNKDGPESAPQQGQARSKPKLMSQVPLAEATALFKSIMASSGPLRSPDGKLVTIRINLINRGVPETCARIYRLPSAPSNPELRKAWLSLLHKDKRQRHSKGKHSLPKLPKDAPPHIAQQRLANSLLQAPTAGQDTYPACPAVEDLIGFVTNGNFNVAEGQGTGIGSILIGKLADQVRQSNEDGLLCIVRNVGADVGRLAKWEIAM